MKSFRASSVDYEKLYIHDEIHSPKQHAVLWAIDTLHSKNPEIAICLCKDGKWHDMRDFDIYERDPNRIDVYRTKEEAEEQLKTLIEKSPSHFAAYTAARMLKGIKT